MNKTIKQIALLGMFLVSTPQALGAAITNGDFAENCSLSGWNQDGESANFNISGTAPNCTANVSVTDTNWNNTLWQSMDLSASANDSSFLLSMDFDVSTDDLSGLILDDYVSIGLVNEDTFEFVSIFEDTIWGNDSFSINFELDSSFINQNWALEFQLIDEFDDFLFGNDDDVYTSMLSISKVSLTEVLAPNNQIPEPTSLAIFALGFAGLMSRRKLANESIRKSHNK